MILAACVLAALLLCAGWALTTGSAISVLALSTCCGAWLPVNNGRLEGPVLIRVSPGHGLTAMDLFAYGGLLLAVGVSVAARRSLRIPLAMACCAVVALGLASAYFLFSGPDRPLVHPGNTANHAGTVK